MQSLALALLFVAAAALTVGVALAAASVPTEIAGGIASSLMALMPYVHKSIDRSLRRQPSSSERIPSLEDFGIPRALAAIYAACMLLAAMQLGPAVGLAAAAVSASRVRDLKAVALAAAVGIGALAITVPGTFLIGRWIGRRARRTAALAVVGAVVIARILGSIVDWFMLPAQQVAEILGKAETLGLLSTQIIIGVPVLSIVALLGYWRGRRQRLAYYMVFLLRIVPKEEREALVELAHEGAKKARAG